MNRLGQDGPHEIKNHPWLKGYPWDKLYNKELESPFIPNVRKTFGDGGNLIFPKGE